MIENTHILSTILSLPFGKKTRLPVTSGPLQNDRSLSLFLLWCYPNVPQPHPLLSESPDWCGCHFQPFPHSSFWRQKSWRPGLVPQPSHRCLGSLPNPYQPTLVWEQLFLVSRTSLPPCPQPSLSLSRHHLCSTRPGQPACVGPYTLLILMTLPRFTWPVQPHLPRASLDSGSF